MEVLGELCTRKFLSTSFRENVTRNLEPLPKHPYIGRFAPTPTGKLHTGSLYAALVSYCEAKKHNGKWLLRIEDLDPPREVRGASRSFIEELTIFGFQFDKDVVFQSQPSRQTAYQNALNKLIKNGQTYNCSCSRSQLKDVSISDHKCRNSTVIPNKPYSINLKVPNQKIGFNDIVQGYYSKNLLKDCGDCVLKRKDSFFSYQLAVVVDDHFQKVSDIVRGIDLIESTPWQIHLNALLDYQQPSYAHIPILVNTVGQKLSKQTFAKEVNSNKPLEALINAYKYLNQTETVFAPKTIDEFWKRAITHWNINKLDKIKAILV